MLLAAASNGAMAEWVRVAGNDDRNITVYFNPAVVRKDDGMAEMMILIDLKAARKDVGNKKYKSAKDQNEYDCREGQSRRRALYEYAGNMGSGEVVYSDSFTTRWEPVLPDSGTGLLWKIACGKQ